MSTNISLDTDKLDNHHNWIEVDEKELARGGFKPRLDMWVLSTQQSRFYQGSYCELDGIVYKKVVSIGGSVTYYRLVN